MVNDGQVSNASPVIEYELDFEDNVATQVWSCVSDPVVYTFALGEPNYLDDRGIFINCAMQWGSAHFERPRSGR